MNRPPDAVSGRRAYSPLGQLILARVREFFREPEALLDGVVVSAPAHAQDFHVAGGRLDQAFDDFNGGGFAGAVGPKQAEAFAGLDG